MKLGPGLMHIRMFVGSLWFNARINQKLARLVHVQSIWLQLFLFVIQASDVQSRMEQSSSTGREEQKWSEMEYPGKS